MNEFDFLLCIGPFPLVVKLVDLFSCQLFPLWYKYSIHVRTEDSKAIAKYTKFIFIEQFKKIK